MDKIIEKKTGWRAAFTRKALPWWLGAGLAVLILFLIIKPAQSTLRVNGDTVTVSDVKSGEFNDYIRLSGTVQPLVTIQISPIEGGIVDAIFLEEGSMVKQGDEILRLSNDNLDLQILNSEAELAEKENILRNTQIQMEQDRLNVKQSKAEYQLNVKRLKRTYEQQKALYEDKLIAREDYLKAKEDFVGGNAIDTNREAQTTVTSKTLTDGNGNKLSVTVDMPTPNVNVHLLNMTQWSAEETVFLSDEVDIPTQIRDLLTRVEILKLQHITGHDGVTDDFDRVSVSGVDDDSFTIPYAMLSGLTENEWKRLLNGQPVTRDYTYDDASSHGAVGYFTFTLTPSATKHDTETPGDQAEEYTLKIRYTPYQIGERDGTGQARPQNVYNGSKGPGTQAIDDMTSTNTLTVNVVTGSIEITKRIDNTLLTDPDGNKITEDRTYTFCLSVLKDGVLTPVLDAQGEPLTQSVTFHPNDTSGTAVFTGLARGEYVVTEQSGEAFVVKGISIIKPETNCLSDSDPSSATFHLGFDTDDLDVITRETNESGYHIIYSTDRKSVGRLGAAEYLNTRVKYQVPLPVKKNWVNALPLKESVYVMLLDKSGAPVTNGDEENPLPLVLRLSAENGANWSGSFSISADERNHNPIGDGYSIRELSGVTDHAVGDYKKAYLLNPAEGMGEVIWYSEALEEGDWLRLGDSAYVVSYSADDTTLYVTNRTGGALPATGGGGAAKLSALGLALMATAVYGAGLTFVVRFHRKRKEARKRSARNAPKTMYSASRNVME